MPRKKLEDNNEKIKTLPNKELKGKELEKVAEKESVETEKKIKKEQLLEKAKKLKEKIETTSTESLKE